MAQVLTAFEAYGHEVDEPLVKRFRQIMVLYTTGATSDVTYDFSSFGGTFWTAALAAAAPYNAIAAQALQVLKTIQMGAKTFIGSGGDILAGLVPSGGGAPASGAYEQVITTHVPAITFHASEGPTTGVFYLQWDLQNGIHPVKLSNPA